MNDDQQRADTDPRHTIDRRTNDREMHDVRERLTRAERKIEDLTGAMYGSPDGLGLQHVVNELDRKMDKLVDSDSKRLPRWAQLLLWTLALGIGAAIACASLGVGR